MRSMMMMMAAIIMLVMMTTIIQCPPLYLPVFIHRLDYISCGPLVLVIMTYEMVALLLLLSSSTTLGGRLLLS